MVSEALAAKGIARQVPETCEHTPDQLDNIGVDFTGNEIHMLMECEGCQKRLREVYRYSLTIPEK